MIMLFWLENDPNLFGSSIYPQGYHERAINLSIDISGKEFRDVPWNVSTMVLENAHLIFTRCLIYCSKISIKNDESLSKKPFL
ncbi:hypothetical protein Anacy_5544 [Anabaena cylindrica PCC 7122]|uniref:Uncharacterized protein n=1 Tax=Anabaena cylindrica (strain ATCC 27899 / PCC 7122) TaxID=272123 RepID=K9ZNT1_ANACC|nr:hypothetical protein Anacy_5544 [Anabaena cylindrica PCC 7122]BAY02051.1 hypothetical protein NIES19_12880 [Anabaena cylindrica PCC 7122]